MGIHHRYVPPAPLVGFVESFWSYESDEPGCRLERRLPDGSTSLIINLRDDLIRIYDRHALDQFQTCRGSVLNGAHSAFMLIDTACQEEIVGVQFRPGGAFPFFDIPASELHNATISLDTLWGGTALNLREQLLAARTWERRVLVLEQCFLARLIDQAKTVHPVVAYALNEFHRASYSLPSKAISDRVGMGQTQFIHVFRNVVGLTPKQYCRVQRFQEVLRRLEKEVSAGWVELALRCGYYDQAHFIHDFRSFAGLTPGAYLARQGEHRNHIALLDEPEECTTAF